MHVRHVGDKDGEQKLRKRLLRKNEEELRKRNIDNRFEMRCSAGSEIDPTPDSLPLAVPGLFVSFVGC